MNPEGAEAKLMQWFRDTVIAVRDELGLSLEIILICLGSLVGQIMFFIFNNVPLPWRKR